MNIPDPVNVLNHHALLSKITTKEQIEKMGYQLLHSKIIEIDCGHSVQGDKPEELANEFLKWTSKL